MEYRYIIVLITVPNHAVGEQISKLLVENRLAACVNQIDSVSSLFRWEGSTSVEEEGLLVVKTRADLFESQLVPAVKAAHPYDVPEIIALPIVMGLESYLGWIEAETT